MTLTATRSGLGLDELEPGELLGVYHRRHAHEGGA
jgi:hypothetical protein